MDGADSYENDGDSPWANSSPGGEEERRPNKEKKSNALPLWGNDRTMNMNPLILTNIQSSSYFKVNLYDLKTYHEVIDEIFYKVTHLEPWEKGSRKTAGQTGMCGGVRGVGAGGIVSTAYCLLYKLFTLKLTRKQVNGLLTHPDSPYIRGLGFMYIRYTQPPADLWDWYDEYLEDPETMDVKAGGGQMMTVGDMLRAFLTKLEWFSTLFPRIPVPIQQLLQRKMAERFPPAPPPQPVKVVKPRHIPDEEVSYGEAERFSKQRRPDGSAVAGRGMDRDRRRGSLDRDRRSPDRDRRSPDRNRRGSPDRRPSYASDKRDRRRERPSSRERRDPTREKASRPGGSHSSRDSHRSRDHEPKRSRHDDDFPSEDSHYERDRHGGDRHKHNGKSRHRHR